MRKNVLQGTRKECLFSCKGFTLVELLIVLTVIAILAILLLPKISDLVTKQKSNELATQVMSIGQAEESYYKDCGTYPNDNAINALWNKNIASSATNNQDNISASNCWVQPYMQALPPNLTASPQNYWQSPFGSASKCTVNTNAGDYLNDGANNDIVVTCTNIPSQAVTFLQQKFNSDSNSNTGLMKSTCNGVICTINFVVVEN
ncbi:hypothetical protein DESAMIL20_318 [Desulfurella amilsii]|jgi:prepilin-type N-terminal cleavage/methylation domain-containing protein|uniref:Type IV pilin PilA n=1 Tax=Desulfurella amilsii TaxID=1562698 RepID=A0A1X4XZE4_9BACT|nr:prepilin-type N-terminal cleavage/methylation domain-containing protein [Desulfurella amilsii]OSS42888.1 hypothetical protein DESAMIL20_318 [Desulfurella amilsii]